jgi:hypothetical protein
MAFASIDQTVDQMQEVKHRDLSRTNLGGQVSRPLFICPEAFFTIVHPATGLEKVKRRRFHVLMPF